MLMAQLIHRHTHMPIIRCSEKVYAYLRAVACMLTCAHCTAVSNKSGVHVNYALAERSAECALQQFNPGWTLGHHNLQRQKLACAQFNNYCARTLVHTSQATVEPRE